MAGTSANIFSRCLPAAGTNVEACGAITACNAIPLQSGDLATIYGSSDSTYKILSNLVSADFVGKAVGVRQNGMYDLLQANKKVLGGKRLSVSQVAGGVWEIQPFIKMGRKRPANTEYWTVRVVNATGATPTQTDGTTFALRFYSQGSIPVDARWFPSGIRVFVSGGTSADDGASTDTAYRLAFVTGSDAATGSDGNGNYVQVTCSSRNEASFFRASATASIQNKAKIPANLAAGAVLGLAVRGTPNVSDYESFCSEIPALNTNQLVPFWIETTRYSICEDELTQKYLAALRDSNPYFKQFGDVEQVEVNRQIIEDFQRRHANNFFFNKPYSTNQTLAAYNSLPAINTANSGLTVPAEARCIGRRANATGVYEQLAECGRVADLQGEKLNLQILFNTLYNLQREREATGVKSDIIELFTDSYFANQIVSGMVNYFKGKFGADVFRINYQLNQGGEQGPFGFRFFRFELDYPQVELRIVTHRFFDDYVAAQKAASGTTNVGRSLWALDWTSIYQGIIDANSVVNKTGDLKALAAVDDTYRCVMKVPTRSTKLNSVTYTAIVETESTSFVLENFEAATPVTTGEWTSSDTYV